MNPALPGFIKRFFSSPDSGFDHELALNLTELIGLAYVHYFESHYGKNPASWPRNARANYAVYAPFQLPDGFEIIKILTIDPLQAGKKDSLMVQLMETLGDGFQGGRVSVGFLLKQAATYYLVLRGTAALPEWIRDSMFEQARWSFLSHGKRNFVKVHHGFARLYSSLQPELHQFQFSHQRFRKPRLIITGHSLGGALAQLCALQLHVHHPLLYTFATPRVGDAYFASNLKRLVPRSYRVEHSPDPFIQMPRKESRYIDGRRFYYEHAGNQVRMHTHPREALRRVLRSRDLIHAHQLKTYAELLERHKPRDN